MSGLIGHCGMLLWSIDDTTQAIIDEIVIAPPVETITAMNAAILTFKRYGYWDRLDRLAVPRGIDTEQGGFVDWKVPTVSVVKYGSASWSQADGFVGVDAVGSYFDTQFIPANATNYTLNDCSMGCYIKTKPTADNHAYFGRTGGTANQAVYLLEGTTDSYDGKINSSAGGGSTTGVTDVGLAVIGRTASNAWYISQNGVSVCTDTDTSGGRHTSSILICADQSGSRNSNAKISAWYAGDNFTLAEQVIIKSILDTYFTAVGA